MVCSEFSVSSVHNMTSIMLSLRRTYLSICDVLLSVQVQMTMTY